MKHRALLSTRLSFIMLAMAALPCAMLGFGFGLLFEKTAIESLESRARSVGNLSALSLTNPLYTSDISAIDKVSRNVALLPGVVRVAVLDAEAKMLSDGTEENAKLFEPQSLPATWAEGGVESLEEEQGSIVYTMKIRLEENLIGYMVLEYSTEELRSGIVLLDWMLIATASLTLVLAAGGILLLRRSIGPLKSLVSATDELRAGEVDLNIFVQVRRADEIGKVAANFNSFIERINATVVLIKGAIAGLGSSGRALAEAMDKTAASVKTISASIAAAQERSLEQGAGITEVSSAMEQISRNLESLFRLVEGHTAAFTSSSASIERMIESIGSVARTIEDSVASSRRLQASSSDGRARISEAKALVEGIAGRAKALEDANRAVEDIAARTNLLAMNAAIEAAHAGNAGRGFAVVAAEIRKLAESATSHSRQISESIASITGGIAEVVRSTERVGQSFVAMSTDIEAIGSSEGEVLRSVSEQERCGAELLETLGEMNRLTAEMRNGASEMSEGGIMVAGEMRNLLQSTENIRRNMQEVVDGVSLVNAATTKALELSRETTTATDSVNAEVLRFKLRGAS